MINRIKKLFKPETIADRSKEAEKKYLDWLKSYDAPGASTKVELQRCYVDRNGNNWYFSPNPLHMTKERSDRLDDALLESEYRIEKADLSERFQTVIESFANIEKQEILLNAFAKMRRKVKLNKEIETAEISTLVEQGIKALDKLALQKTAKDLILDAEYRLKTIGNAEIVLKIAVLFFYIDDENPYVINELTQARKKKLIQEDDELRSFFLKTTYDAFLRSTNTDGAFFLKSINKSQAVLPKKERVFSKSHGTSETNKSAETMQSLLKTTLKNSDA